MDRQDNFSKYLSYRKEYPRFIYDSYGYSWNDNYLVLRYKFLIPHKFEFQPEIRIRWNQEIFRSREDFSDEMLENLVFHIGMIEMISYWKAACPPVIVLPGKKLPGSELGFWRKLYFHGLGEFFYMNSIEPDMGSFVDFEGIGSNGPGPMSAALSGPPVVPMGGGKDSAVTAGLLSHSGLTWLPFAINPTEATMNVVKACGKTTDEVIIVERRIDPLLLQLNSAGYLNGHTPFSAVVAFYSLLIAYLTGSRDIVLSNESSANEPTVPGTGINHQYSKTLEFEKDFRDYVRGAISGSFNYFSLLRPLTELQIGKLFSHFPEFFGVFRSCNAGSKSGVWCGKCPKCLFTWIILSPFMEQDRLRHIFGKDLLLDPELIPVMDELSGVAENKPFECIGTIDEVNVALDYLASHYPEKELPLLLEHHRNHRTPGQIPEHHLGQHLLSWNPDHFVPENYLQLLKNEGID